MTKRIIIALALGAAACGGAPFGSLQNAELHDAAAPTADADPDAGDAGAEFEAAPPVDAPAADASDAGIGVDSGDPVHDAGHDATDAPDGAAIALAACETYHRGYVNGCTCQLGPADAGGPSGPCSSFEYDDAGGLDCTRADLGTCEPACGWDGGATDYAKLCECIFACLGACAPTNALYFECRVQTCTASDCP